MGSARINPDRNATFEYCLDMLWQIADLLQREAGQPSLAAIVRAIVAAQRRVGMIEDDGLHQLTPDRGRGVASHAL